MKGTGHRRWFDPWLPVLSSRCPHCVGLPSRRRLAPLLLVCCRFGLLLVPSPSLPLSSPFRRQRPFHPCLLYAAKMLVKRSILADAPLISPVSNISNILAHPLDLFNLFSSRERVRCRVQCGEGECVPRANATVENCT